MIVSIICCPPRPSNAAFWPPSEWLFVYSAQTSHRGTPPFNSLFTLLPHQSVYRFPAETIKIDTSGRAFDRMSSTRKSLVCYTTTRQKKEGDAAKPEEDTVRRRSRLRRPRGKRRNTIASSDQREIAEVINKGYVNGKVGCEGGNTVLNHRFLIAASSHHHRTHYGSALDPGCARAAVQFLRAVRLCVWCLIILMLFVSVFFCYVLPILTKQCAV